MPSPVALTQKPGAQASLTDNRSHYNCIECNDRQSSSAIAKTNIGPPNYFGHDPIHYEGNWSVDSIFEPMWCFRMHCIDHRLRILFVVTFLFD